MSATFATRFDRNILTTFKGAVRASLRDPRFALFFLKTIRRQKAAAVRRDMLEKDGLRVPPLLIASLTAQCNLSCKGCYARAHRRSGNGELSGDEWIRIIGEAEALGVSIVMLAGGEPFLRTDLLDVTERFPGLVFPVFTNGLVMTDPVLRRLKKQKHVIPVVSIEGFEKQTDERRGAGVFGRLQETLSRLKRNGIFYGISVTVNRENFDHATDEKFIRGLFKGGCRLFFFIEYTPVEESTGHLVLTELQRTRLRAVEEKLRPRFPGVFIVFPGDEEQYGGCLAAGRGFVHVGPDGGLEPCPFAPYSDTNLRHMSFKDTLQSVLLKRIRDNHDKLNETSGGCALWNNREWVRTLVPSANASKSGPFEWKCVPQKGRFK
jgi:MoaA/NifB/PqqE/SkfB family radical SAM enzyme